MITLSTHRKDGTITVRATTTISAGITIHDMPGIDASVLEATLTSYMQRGLDAFHQAAGNLNKSVDPSLPPA